MFTTVPARAAAGAATFALALTALALPATSLAAHHGHHGSKAHRAKVRHKKKKGSSGASVRVKCASVTVTCKGKPGPAGPQGPAGPAGAPGAPGVNAQNIVLRAQQTAPIETKITEARIKQCEAEKLTIFSCGVAAPIAPASWTEAGNEDDQLLGDFTATLPSEKACDHESTGTPKELEPAELLVAVFVDGRVVGLAEARGGSEQTTVTGQVAFDLGLLALESGGEFGSGFFLGNGSPQVHSLALEAGDDCPEKAAHPTLSQTTVYVLGTA